MSDEQRARVFKLHAEGYSAQDIGETVALTGGMVRYALRKAGLVPIPSRGLSAEVDAAFRKAVESGRVKAEARFSQWARNPEKRTAPVLP